MADIETTAPAPGALRQRILGQVGKLAEREVYVQEWGSKVLVRELSGRQAKDFEVAVARGSEDQVGFLLQMCLVDPETGGPIFEPGDRAALEGLGMAALKPLLEAAQELSGLSEADVAKAKASLRIAP